MGLNACPFQPQTTRGSIIKPAQVAHATVRQRVSAADGEHTTPRATTDDLRTMVSLEGGNHALCRARSVFTGEYNEWKFDLRQSGGMRQAVGKRFRLTGAAGPLCE